MNKKRLTQIFWAAGIYNIVGVLLFSMGFTNKFLGEYYPTIFSNFGLIAIMLWGLAYISVSRVFDKVPYLMFVFVIEKLVYVISWIYFLVVFGPLLTEIYQRTLLSGLFLTVYGFGDLVFGCFFAWVGIKIIRKKI